MVKKINKEGQDKQSSLLSLGNITEIPSFLLIRSRQKCQDAFSSVISHLSFTFTSVVFYSLICYSQQLADDVLVLHLFNPMFCGVEI